MALRYIGARGRRALLALVLERAAQQADEERVGRRRLMRDHEVLAACLADEPRIRAVAVELSLTVDQILEGAGGPVKWMPARSGWGRAASATPPLWPVTMLMTPGGSPASSSSCMSADAANCWVVAGFHTTVLPISAGAVGRLPAIDVKLNGVIASTKPSSARSSMRFQTPGGEIGWSSLRWAAKCTLNRQKSTSSAGGVDLRLEDCLALAEHRRRVDARTPRAGEEIGGAKENSGAGLEGCLRPLVACTQRGVDGPGHLQLCGGVALAEDEPVVVRGCDGERLAGALDVGATDVHGQAMRRVDGELVQRRADGGALGRAGAVLEDGLVAGSGG